MTCDSATRREYLVRRLEERLYRSFYIRGRPVPDRPGETSPVRPDRAYVEAMSAANAGHGGWEPGWHVEAVDGRFLEVARDGLRVRVPASECRTGRSAGAGLVSVPRPKELRATSPGFYVALGDTQPVGGDVGVQVRVYFHLTAAGAAPLVAIATRLLNEAALPFSLKVPNHPAAFTRCDAAVLYLDDFVPAHQALRGIISSCASYLRREPPAFAKPLSPGAAVGEHVASHGASFGTSRCRFLAEAVVAAREHRAFRLADRVDVVARCFADRGIDLDAPYLAPGSSDAYEL